MYTYADILLQKIQINRDYSVYLGYFLGLYELFSGFDRVF